MFAARSRFFCLLGALGLLAGGCATGHSPRQAARDPAHLNQRAEAYAHYASGLIHDQRNELALADRDFALAAAADPDNETLAVDLARRLLQRRQPDHAVNPSRSARLPATGMAEAAVELLSRSAARPHATGFIYGWLGFALDQAGKTDAAVAAFQTASKRSPQLFLAYHGLARIELERKQPAEALKVIDAAMRQPKADADFLVSLAQFLIASARSKDLPDTETKPRVRTLLQRCAKLAPTDPSLLQKMADSYRAIGELVSATELYQNLLQNLLDHQSNANPAATMALHEQLFQLYTLSGQPGKAEAQLREIRNANPANPLVHYLLGSVALDERRYADAMTSFEQALLLAPDARELEPAYYKLAAAQISLHQPQAALDTLTRARARFRPNFFLEFYTGVAQAEAAEYGEALKSYTSAELLAKASEPSSLTETFYYQLGVAQERSGSFEDAERTFRKCLQMAPEDAETLNYLGYSWADRGVNLEEARALIEKAVKLKPEEPAYLDSLAWVLYKLKQPQAALVPMEKAVRLSNKTPDATLFDHLGDIRAASGDAAGAREAWRKALELEPSDALRRKLEVAPATDKP